MGKSVKETNRSKLCLIILGAKYSKTLKHLFQLTVSQINTKKMNVQITYLISISNFDL